MLSGATVSTRRTLEPDGAMKIEISRLGSADIRLLALVGRDIKRRARVGWLIA